MSRQYLPSRKSEQLAALLEIGLSVFTMRAKKRRPADERFLRQSLADKGEGQDKVRNDFFSGPVSTQWNTFAE